MKSVKSVKSLINGNILYRVQIPLNFEDRGSYVEIWWRTWDMKIPIIELNFCDKLNQIEAKQLSEILAQAAEMIKGWEKEHTKWDSLSGSYLHS